MAEGIFVHKLKERGIENEFEVDSCGTGDYHIGEQPDRRTIENARQNGIILDHRARQLRKSDLEEYDHIFVMDESNRKNTLRLGSPEFHEKVELMRKYDDRDPGSDVPDPYFGGQEGFQNVFDILDRSLDNWLDNSKHK